MKLYTRTGDAGETGLYGADRVSKAHPRVDAYGTVDELNSQIGFVRSLLHSPGVGQDGSLADVDADLAALQNALFDLGADLATRHGGPYEKNISRIDADDVAHVEGLIDRYQATVPPLRQFIHPGGTPAAAALHIARAVARRAERDVVRLATDETVNEYARVYLNRLSDLLFVMARAVNARHGVAEESWHVKGRK